MTIGGRQAADVHPESSCDRRPHLAGIELLALDLTALQDIIGKGAEDSFLFDLETKRLHLAKQAPLQMPDCSQRHRQTLVVPTECRPVIELMDIRRQLPHLLR
jgi:hypothetical protein